jgi:hypothetical protein
MSYIDFCRNIINENKVKFNDWQYHLNTINNKGYLIESKYHCGVSYIDIHEILKINDILIRRIVYGYVFSATSERFVWTKGIPIKLSDELIDKYF